MFCMRPSFGAFVNMPSVRGKKMHMGQIFREEDVVPVTFVELQDKEVDFGVGEKVKVSGRSRGRGFQGVIKRHGFKGGPGSHGTKHTHRTGGSIGATGPQRVFPGVKMAGRMGMQKVNVENLVVVAYDKDRNLLALRGALPGVRGSAVTVHKAETKSE